MTETKKATALILLFTLWAGIFIYQYYHQPEQKREPLKFKKGEVPSEGVSRSASETAVRLDLLKSSPQGLLITKNIFAPIQVYVPPPPKPEPPPAPPPVVPPPQPSAEEIARQQAIQGLAEFKYLGYLNKGKSKEQGFFTRGGELFIVGRGEAVVGSFFLKELDPNQAILRDKVTGVESTLNLSN
jgi:hypothetical protein